jgi:hypothetical protein
MPLPSSAIIAKLKPQLPPIQTTNDGQHYLSLVATTTQQLLSSHHSPFMPSLKQQAGQLIHKISQMFTPRRLSTSTVRTHRKRSSTNSFFRMFQSKSNEVEGTSTSAGLPPLPSWPAEQITTFADEPLTPLPAGFWRCHECKQANRIGQFDPDHCPICAHDRCDVCLP